MRYHFADRTLDLDTLELSDDDGPVDIEPQALQVLTYLVRHSGRVVPKTELLDEVWGDRFVSESALTTRIKQCRRAVGDDGRSQAVIRTSHGVGYRVIAEVRHDSPADATSGSHAVPSAIRPVFGRERAIAALRRRLDEHRLVTITGVGGVGKSTVAVQLLDGVAQDSSESWWCDLTNIRDPGVLATVALSALGIAQQPDADPLESALRVLARRRGVLVLDNCEQLATAAASFATTVLDRCPHVHIVATSRVPLHISSEYVFPIGPLRLDDAVACFCARALAAGVSVDATDPSVLELCRSVDGIPLALELAAGRIRTLAPAQMVSLLRHRFRLLSDPTADDMGRQQSLRRTLEWSWEALSAYDQHLLAALSVMVGTFTLEDAMAVSGADDDTFEVADALDRLVKASLLVSVTDADTHRRFRLLETIRDFGDEMLGDSADTLHRHSRRFARQAQDIDHGLLQSDDADRGLAEMRSIWDNLRAAVRYAVDGGDGETALRIIRAAAGAADIDQAYELLDWCEMVDEAITTFSEDDELICDAQAIKGRMLAHRGDLDRARPLVEDAYARHESPFTALSMIWCCYYHGDLDGVLAAATRLRACRRSPRGMDMSFAETFEAIVAMVHGEPSPADLHVTPDRARAGVLETVDCFIAGLRLRGSDLARATELLEAVIAASLANDYRLLCGAAASMLTQATIPNRPRREAMGALRRTLDMYRDYGMERMINTDILVAARLLADAGDRDDATRLLGAHSASGYLHLGLPEMISDALTDELSSAEPARFTALLEEGSTLSPPEAADVAIRALDDHLATPPG